MHNAHSLLFRMRLFLLKISLEFMKYPIQMIQAHYNEGNWLYQRPCPQRRRLWSIRRIFGIETIICILFWSDYFHRFGWTSLFCSNVACIADGVRFDVILSCPIFTSFSKTGLPILFHVFPSVQIDAASTGWARYQALSSCSNFISSATVLETFSM